jgi:hypothetical protein
MLQHNKIKVQKLTVIDTHIPAFKIYKNKRPPTVKTSVAGTWEQCWETFWSRETVQCVFSTRHHHWGCVGSRAIAKNPSGREIYNGLLPSSLPRR